MFSLHSIDLEDDDEELDEPGKAEINCLKEQLAKAAQEKIAAETKVQQRELDGRNIRTRLADLTAEE